MCTLQSYLTSLINNYYRTFTSKTHATYVKGCGLSCAIWCSLGKTVIQTTGKTCCFAKMFCVFYLWLVTVWIWLPKLRIEQIQTGSFSQQLKGIMIKSTICGLGQILWTTTTYVFGYGSCCCDIGIAWSFSPARENSSLSPNIKHPSKPSLINIGFVHFRDPYGWYVRYEWGINCFASTRRESNLLL